VGNYLKRKYFIYTYTNEEITMAANIGAINGVEEKVAFNPTAGASKDQGTTSTATNLALNDPSKNIINPQYGVPHPGNSAFAPGVA
jgi:hypothetical protein